MLVFNCNMMAIQIISIYKWMCFQVGVKYIDVFYIRKTNVFKSQNKRSVLFS